MKKFCPSVVPGKGRILGCLKNVFINPKNRLTDTCKEYIEEILEHAAKEDIKYDVDLSSSCTFYMKQCQTNPPRGGSDEDVRDVGDKGYTEECLKQLFREGKILDVNCKRKIGVMIQSSMIDIHVDPILSKQCAIDLVRHCDGMDPGEGRRKFEVELKNFFSSLKVLLYLFAVLKCLFTVLNEEKQHKDKMRLSERCREMLSKRSELFHLADEVNQERSEVLSIVDLVEQVQTSPQRNFLLTMAMSVVGIIFIFGLFCGRVTNRRATEKNK